MRLSHYYYLCAIRHIFTTIRFNLHYFGWKKGFKLPVVFYAPTILRELKGRIIINGDYKYSKISIGLPGNEMFSYSTPCIWVNQGGTVNFEGSFGTNPGAAFVIRRDSHLTIGNQSSFGQNLRILCSKKISIGEHVLGSWDITIMDTDSHLFEKEGKVGDFSKPIVIGDHCFISSGVNILKGSQIPDDAVIAARAVVSGKLSESASLYAGVPAKIKMAGIKYLK